MAKKLNAKAILKAIIAAVGPTDRWVGNCFALASQAVKRGIVEGDAVYGMWHGPISKKSTFKDRSDNLPFVNHGWINLPDGRICDPTRWVFEAVDPYIYIGPNDHYDEGANRLREHQPPPSFDRDDQIVSVSQRVLAGPAFTFMEKLLGGMDAFVAEYFDYEPGTFTVPQLFWVGNRSPAVLGEFAAEIYAALDKLGYGAAVPYDNRAAVERRQAKTVGVPSVAGPRHRTSRPRPTSRASR